MPQCQVYQPVEETVKCAAPGCARVRCRACGTNEEWTCGAPRGACGRVLDDKDGDAVRCVRCPRGFCRGCRPASAAPVSTNAFRCVAHVREVRAPFDVGMIRRRRRGLRGAAVVVDDFATTDEFAGAEFSSDDEAPGDSARADLAAAQLGLRRRAPSPSRLHKPRACRGSGRAPSPPAPAPMPVPMPMMPPHGFGPPGMMPMPMMPMPMQPQCRAAGAAAAAAAAAAAVRPGARRPPRSTAAPLSAPMYARAGAARRAAGRAADAAACTYSGGLARGPAGRRARGATPSRRRRLHKFSRRSARRRRPPLLLHRRRAPRSRTPTRRSASWRYRGAGALLIF